MRLFFIFCFFEIFSSVKVFSVEIDTIILKRKIFPLFPSGISLYRGIAPDVIIGGDFKKGDLQFCIAIKDENLNNKFNDVGMDLLLIGKYGVDSLYKHESISCIEICQSTYINYHGNFFEVNFISPDGEFLILKQTYNPYKMNIEASCVAKYFDSIPKIPFEGIDGKQKHFEDYLNKGKFVYVNFWGTWCQGCINSLPYLQKINTNYSSNVNIISINYRDNKDFLQKFILENNMKWTHGINSELISKEFLLNGYPYGALFDQYGKLIQAPISSKKVLEFLDNSYKKK